MKFNQLQRELRQREELKKQQLQAEIPPPHVDKDVGSNKVATNFFRNQNQNMNKESNSKWEQGQNKIIASNSYGKDEGSPKTKSEFNLKFSKEQYNEEKKIISKEENEKMMKLVEDDFE